MLLCAQKSERRKIVEKKWTVLMKSLTITSKIKIILYYFLFLMPYVNKKKFILNATRKLWVKFSHLLLRFWDINDAIWTLTLYDKIWMLT